MAASRVRTDWANLTRKTVFSRRGGKTPLAPIPCKLPEPIIMLPDRAPETAACPPPTALLMSDEPDAMPDEDNAADAEDDAELDML
jgi:hypothetical protein